MHMTHVAEVGTECRIIICQLIGNNGLKAEEAPTVNEVAVQL